MDNAAHFSNIAEIKAANVASGQHFFDRDAMAFFGSRIEGRAVYGGRYFITSEARPAIMSVAAGARMFTIREAAPDGSIDTVGEFQQFRFIEDARAAAKALVRAQAVDDFCATDGEAQSRHERGTSDCRSPFLWQRGRDIVIDPRTRAQRNVPAVEGAIP